MKTASTTTSETIRGTGFIAFVCTSTALARRVDASYVCSIVIDWHEQGSQQYAYTLSLPVSTATRGTARAVQLRMPKFRHSTTMLTRLCVTLDDGRAEKGALCSPNRQSWLSTHSDQSSVAKGFDQS